MKKVVSLKPIYKLWSFEFGNAAHLTPSDLGTKQLRSLKRAITGSNNFSTGWYSCKKECVSTKIVRVGKVYKVSVSVVDDYDNEALVEETINAEGKPAQVWSLLKQSIEKAWKEALAVL